MDKKRLHLNINFQAFVLFMYILCVYVCLCVCTNLLQKLWSGDVTKVKDI